MLQIANELSLEIDNFLVRSIPSLESDEEIFLREAQNALNVAKKIIKRIDRFVNVSNKIFLQNETQQLHPFEKETIKANDKQKKVKDWVGEHILLLKDFHFSEVEKEDLYRRTAADSCTNLKIKSNELWERMHSLTIQFHVELKRRGELESFLAKEEKEFERFYQHRISHKRAKRIAKEGQKFSKMVQEKACFAYASHKNFGYVFGGLNSKNEVLNSVEYCNLETGEWTPLAPLTEDFFHDGESSLSSSSSNDLFSSIETPICRFGWSAVVVGDDIYVTGGSDFYASHNTTYVFHTIKRTWRKGPEMRSARYLHASASVGSRIFVFGGFGCSMCEMLDSSSDTLQWISLPEIPFAAYDYTAATIESRIYICCVHHEDGDNLSVCLVFNTETLQWEPVIKMTTKLLGGAAIAIGNQLHVVGAATDVDDFVKDDSFAVAYEILDPTTYRFLRVSSTIKPRCYHGIFATPQHSLMLVGGMTPRSPQKSRRISTLYYGWDQTYRHLSTSFSGGDNQASVRRRSMMKRHFQTFCDSFSSSLIFIFDTDKKESAESFL